ncbi:MAG: malto-oligosyltrehalose synthase [Pseudomonadota bacterium]
MHLPVATYRVQFNPSFGFKSAREIIPYLAALGISDLYASPIFKAKKGSTHGYDIVDPNQLNPELGEFKDFAELTEEVKHHNLSWLQDIVPNHMAFDSENEMLMDVLEFGENSNYFHFFDIDWNHPYENMKGRVLAPLLGKMYGECLEDGEIQLKYDGGMMTINYYNLRFPLRIESYAQVFEQNLDQLEQRLSGNEPVFLKFLGAVGFLKTISSAKEIGGRDYQVKHGKRMLCNLYTENPVIKEFIEENISFFNGERGNSESFNALDKLISEQLFRLSFWKVANEEINYRRFFIVNDLISLKVEEEPVLQHTHNLIFRLIREGKFNGLRVDHIDGLYDPLTYLKKLREEVGDIYLVVEKILEVREELPSLWPVQGTTGYDFMNYVNGIFCNQDNVNALSKIYYRFADFHYPYEELLCDKKRLIIGKYLAGNIDYLAQIMKKISSKDRFGADITLYGIRRALVEVMANFPVYRTYLSEGEKNEGDHLYIKEAIRKAKERSPGLLLELNFIEKFLLLQFNSTLTEEDKREWTQLVMNFQQYTGPLMAKGFEDTFLYHYNRLISLNEVGSNPHLFGFSVSEFQEFNGKRAKSFPHSLNATATHDTKRGEDVRARINVLSELPEEWGYHLKTWSNINRRKKRRIGNIYAPDENDEYFLYQTLLGTFPFREDEKQQFKERIKSYMVKAVREAKVHTGWIKPDTAYEAACVTFIDSILTSAEENRFLDKFLPFQKKVAFYGIFNSLSQTLLKITCPGVPDFYQGSELWDFNLVDPDNRRPVDFKKQEQFLWEIKQKEQLDILNLVEELVATKEDGRIKLFLIYRALKARKGKREVFEKGVYLPLKVEGKFNNQVVAFARTYENDWIITVAPRFFTTLIKEREYPLGEKVWEDTYIVVPENAPSYWKEAITGQVIPGEKDLFMGKILKYFSVAMLVGTK